MQRVHAIIRGSSSWCAWLSDEKLIFDLSPDTNAISTWLLVRQIHRICPTDHAMTPSHGDTNQLRTKNGNVKRQLKGLTQVKLLYQTQERPRPPIQLTGSVIRITSGYSRHQIRIHQSTDQTTRPCCWRPSSKNTTLWCRFDRVPRGKLATRSDGPPRGRWPPRVAPNASTNSTTPTATVPNFTPWPIWLNCQPYSRQPIKMIRYDRFLPSPSLPLHAYTDSNMVGFVVLPLLNSLSCRVIIILGYGCIQPSCIQYRLDR